MKYQIAIKNHWLENKLILENKQDLWFSDKAYCQYHVQHDPNLYKHAKTEKDGRRFKQSFHSFIYSLFLSKDIDEVSTKYLAWFQVLSNKIDRRPVFMKLMHLASSGIR